MTPGSRDISIYQGDTYVHELRIKDSNSANINITGRTYSGQIKVSKRSSTVTANFTATITNAANGVVQFSLTPAQTANIDPGTYYYDFQQLDGVIKLTLVAGSAVVSGEVTNGS
jgi:hypothetical protein